MSEDAWILIGMMGVGKSTTGGILAELSNREHLDSDRMLVQKLGRPIPQIFQLFGESAFRDHETSILRGIERGLKVISTGGGIVLRPDNWIEMRRLGKIIFLDVPLPILVARLAVSKKRRPLIQGGDMETKVADILNDRQPLYRQADLVVQIDDDDAASAAKKVLQVVEQFL